MINGDIKATAINAKNELQAKYSSGLVSFAEYMQLLNDLSGNYIAEQNEHDMILQGKIIKACSLAFLKVGGDGVYDKVIADMIHDTIRGNPSETINYTRPEIRKAIESLLEN